MAKTATTKKGQIFNSYDEAMSKLFPVIWEAEKSLKESEKKKEMDMGELAEQVLSHF